MNRRQLDLRIDKLPVISADDWSRPTETMSLLYRRAEQYAIESRDWYLADKRTKRQISKILRAAMILLGIVGAVIPLVAAVGVRALDSNWGYVALALAGGCAAFDKIFGFSSGWARDIAGAQAIQTLLANFQLVWAEASAGRDSSPETVVERLEHLRHFVASVNSVVADETTTWRVEFTTVGDNLVNNSISRASL